MIFHVNMKKLMKNILFIFRLRTTSPLTTHHRAHSPVRETDNLDVIIVAAMCGREAMDEGLVMLKSAVIFQNSSNLKFIIICDYNRQEELNNRVNKYSYLPK